MADDWKVSRLARKAFFCGIAGESNFSRATSRGRGDLRPIETQTISELSLLASRSLPCTAFRRSARARTYLRRLTSLGGASTIAANLSSASAVHGNSPAIVFDLLAMYQHQLHQQINQCLKEKDFPDNDAGILFHTRFIANGAAIRALYDEIYGSHPKARESFASLLTIITRAFIERPESMKDKDDE